MLADQYSNIDEGFQIQLRCDKDGIEKDMGRGR